MTQWTPSAEVQHRTRAAERSDCGIPLPFPMADLTSLESKELDARRYKRMSMSSWSIYHAPSSPSQTYFTG